MKAKLFLLILLSITPIFAADESTRIFNDALFKAAEQGNVAEITALMAKGANINAKQQSGDGHTPLIVAVRKGHLPAVKALIQAGADVNLKDELNQATALMWAVRKGDKNPVRQTASIEQKYEIGDLLIASKAEVNAKNRWGGTALQWATDAKNLRMVKALIAAGADVNIGDEAGLTPLMVAANYEGPDFLEMVKLMINAGAKVDVQDETGMTALMKAAMNHHKPETIRYLVSKGADINAKTLQGETALMIASRTARSEVVAYLIEAGADLKAKNEKGQTAMAVAKEAGYPDVINVLMKAGAPE